MPNKIKTTKILFKTTLPYDWINSGESEISGVIVFIHFEIGKVYFTNHLKFWSKRMCEND